MQPRLCHAAFCLVMAGGGVFAAELEFNRDVRPVLAAKCFACHGFDAAARKADLRLDMAEAAYAVREGTAAVVPYHPEQSELWRRIYSDDPDVVMPPPESHAELTATEKKLLQRWIETGAPYEKHWSFVVPKKAEVPPPVEQLGRHVGSEIDRFVQQRLQVEGLAPAPLADRETLLRRLSLDLTGLPATEADVKAFLYDARATRDLVVALVDRLLESPHFGERMALEWLDAARYADTNGYSIDGGRHMWMWRDWVIQAFNDNKPYDRFLLEQLAGDLLAERTDAELIATGFQRNNMVTHEGGTLAEENLTNYNVDRVKTLGEAVLGLTLGCAQCHDHKYDPLRQVDYYGLYAYFNTLGDRGHDGDGGNNPSPSQPLKTVLRAADVPLLDEKIASLKARLAAPDADVMTQWVSEQRTRLARRGENLQVHGLVTKTVSTPNRGAGFEVVAPNTVTLRNAGPLGAFDILNELPRIEAPLTGLRLLFHPQADLPNGGRGMGAVRTIVGDRRLLTSRGDRTPADEEAWKKVPGTFVVTGVSVTADATPSDQVNLHRLLPVAGVTANSWMLGWRPEDALVRLRHRGWSPDPLAEGPAALTLTFAEPIKASETPYLVVQVNFGYGHQMIAGQIELQVLTGTDDGFDVDDDVAALVALPEETWTADERARVWSLCAELSADLAETRQTLANLEERKRAMTEPQTVMVMREADKPRETFLLHRGDYAQPREKVTAATPAVLPPLPMGAPANRLGLAQWLVMPEHPLTARVAVNRIWQMLMGTGLVATTADFGAQGEWPSHPELLDWLAVDFVEHGWDVKRLVRQIVLSHTYQQSSVATPEQLERDRDNRLLARGPRFRLAAELIRDQALAVSGLLQPQLGGPSVNPYTPGDLWREVSHYGSTPATSQTFVQDHGDKLYRRSIYTYWKRTAPPPNMLTFDATNREVCSMKRAMTITPLQSLVLLNDPQFVEASRALAERMLGYAGDDAMRLDFGMGMVLARPASAHEMTRLVRVLERERARYKNDVEAAKALLAIGESRRKRELPVEEHAAWTQVALLLLNLSETITRP